MDDNPYESPAELPLEEDEPAAPTRRPSLAVRVKRITQLVTLSCAVLFFLFRSEVLPGQNVIVLQLLFGATMLGLVVTIACNYFIRPKARPRTAPRRLRVK